MTRKINSPNKKFRFQTGDTILTGLFFVSLSLTIWGINIYRLTIIELKYLFVIFSFGIIVALVIFTYLINSSYSRICTFLIKAGIGGGLSYFSFLFINQQFADKEFLTEQFMIIEKGTLGRGKGSSCYQPYVVIDFNGSEKQLMFYCDFADSVKHSTKVNISYSKGAFGFQVIKYIQLTY